MRAVMATGQPRHRQRRISGNADAGRYMSCCKSSSRDHVTFTGTPAASNLDGFADEIDLPRRPKPPPHELSVSWTFSGLRAVIFTGSIGARRVCICVEALLRTKSARTSAAQLSVPWAACGGRELRKSRDLFRALEIATFSKNGWGVAILAATAPAAGFYPRTSG